MAGHVLIAWESAHSLKYHSIFFIDQSIALHCLINLLEVFVFHHFISYWCLWCSVICRFLVLAGRDMLYVFGWLTKHVGKWIFLFFPSNQNLYRIIWKGPHLFMFLSFSFSQNTENQSWHDDFDINLKLSLIKAVLCKRRCHVTNTKRVISWLCSSSQPYGAL